MPVTDITFDIADTQFPLSQSVLAQLAPAGAGVLLAQIESATPDTFILNAVEFAYTSDPGTLTRFGFDTRVVAGGPFGDTTPIPAEFAGITVISIQSFVDTGIDGGNILVLNGGALLQDAFTSITINGITLLSADATAFFNSPPVTLWVWDAPAPNFVIAAGSVGVLMT